MSTVTREQIVTALHALGLGAGQVVFVHSALSSLGQVQGGAEAVVDAFSQVLGATGTLVVPTFTFAHLQADDPLFDLPQDRSEMGAISECVRTRASAWRSCHLLHSVTVLGTQAESITAVRGPSVWAAASPFGQLYEEAAQVVLLGIPYLRCTWFHVIEEMVQVNYRIWVEREITLWNIAN